MGATVGTKAKCLTCGDIIESKGHRHNFVRCSCGEIFVDGGDDYSRCGFKSPHTFMYIRPDGTEETLAEVLEREEKNTSN